MKTTTMSYLGEIMNDIDKEVSELTGRKILDLSQLRKPLDIKQMEFRVGAKIGNFAQQILAYKNARIDMARLDSVLGPENWQRCHTKIDGTNFCKVGIKIGNEWIWKEDAGEESTQHSEKGGASDSFKRACSNWGIGRELYRLPKIIIRTTEKIYPQSWKWESETNDKGYITELRAFNKDEKITLEFWR